MVQPPEGEAVFRGSKASVEDVVECVEVAAPRGAGYENTADLVEEPFERREILAVDLIDVHDASGYWPSAGRACCRLTEYAERPGVGATSLERSGKCHQPESRPETGASTGALLDFGQNRAMAGRPTVVTPKIERELEVMLALGIRQEVAARALGISTRTVGRYVAERRPVNPETLDELLVEFAQPVPLDELLDEPSPRPRRRTRRSGKKWREAARSLQTAAPERWGADLLAD